MRKALKWVIGCIVVFALLVTGLSYLLRSEMLRAYVEREANRNLKGYSVRVGSAYFHPFTFALDLRNLTLIQGTNPTPPVASIERFRASVHWRELLSRRVVGDIRIDRPKLYVNLKDVRAEEKSKTPLKQKGWQEALFAIYPLKVNVFTIDDGDITYVDEGPFPALHVATSDLQPTTSEISITPTASTLHRSSLEGPSSTRAASRYAATPISWLNPTRRPKRI